MLKKRIVTNSVKISLRISNHNLNLVNGFQFFENLEIMQEKQIQILYFFSVVCNNS